MAGRLNGRVALVTGGARGMGAAHARKLVEEGASVVVGDVRDDEGQVLVKELGDAAHYVHLDVTDESQWAAAVRAATEKYGGLHIVVNNAGIAFIDPVATMPVARYRQVIEVNQVGPFLGLQAAIPALVAAGGGSIINISSIDGLRGNPGMVAYVSSKHAVTGMTKVAALELGGLNIRVNSIHPGGVRTPMLDIPELDGVDVDAMVGAMTAVGRIGRPEEISEMVAFLASDASSYCTGAEFIVDGGQMAGPQLPPNAEAG